MLARVFLQPDRPATIAGLARELGLDDGGLTRETNRLERAGLVRSERVGRNRIVHPNLESPYYQDLYGLLLKSLGPAAVVGPALRDLPGLEQAYLFGSWAARYSGVAGNDPADIDLLLVGSPERNEVYRIARQLSDTLGREVNATIVSSARWADAREGFLREVKQSPLVELALDGEKGPGESS